MLSHGKLITILQYFTDKVDDYWHILYPIEDKKARDEDKYLYFYDNSRKAIDFEGEFKEGIYQFLGYDGEYHTHFLEIAQYTLASFVAWRKKNDEFYLQQALRHSNFLIENQEESGAWRIEHINPIYSDLESPWASALTQAFAISGLIRAYFYTNDEIYLQSAKKACDFLEVPILKEGVKREFDEVFIYEEYPRKELSGVLNGYISTIFAIYELSLIDDSYQELLKKNIENLKKILPKYDLGYWSLYSLDGNISSGFYHRYITIQLKILSEFDEDFSVYYNKFNSYLYSFFNKFKALYNKIRYRVKN